MVDYKSHWFLGDEPLDHYAYNIQRRSASWRVPERRGENYQVPGLDGARFNGSKPFMSNIVALDMWVQGANSDGSVPQSVSEAQKCLDNMDELSRMFGYRGLKELVRAQTTGYGRVNMIPNPSMENAGQKIILRENIINNPSAEKTRDKVIVRRNFADNPGMELASATKAFRTNWVKNSRFANESDEKILLRNWVQNPSVEAGTKYWREQSNVSFGTSRKVRTGGTWPVQGQQSLRCTAVGTGPTNALVEAHSIDIDRTKDWTFSGYVWNRSDQDRTMRMFVRWFNKNGVFISSTSNVDVVVPVEGTTRLNQTILTASIPANTAQASIRFVMVNALQDDVFYVDGAMATPTAALKTYFDGDTDEVDGERYRWQGQASRSVSVSYRVSPKGWMAGTTKVNATATTDHSRRGVQSCKIEVFTATATNDAILQQTTGGACDINEDTYVSGMIYIRRQDLADGAATRTVKLNLLCYDTMGNNLGAVLASPGGSALADSTITIETAQWQPITIESGYTRPDTDKVVLQVKCGEVWSVGEVVYIDTAMVNDAKKIGDWFDGNTDDDDVFHYNWNDDPHWSASEERGKNILGWDAEFGREYRTEDGYVGDYAMHLEPYRTPDSTDRPAVSSTALDVRPGRKHMLSAWVNLSRSHSIRLGYSTDTGETWTYGGATAPSANTWTRLTFGFTLPAGVTPEQTLIRVASNAAPADGDVILVDAVLFEPAELARPYFDGESGGRFRWMDDRYRSVSVREMPRANGWQGYGNAYPIVRQVKDSTATQGSYVAKSVASQAGDMGVTFAQDGIDPDLDYSFGIDLKPSVTRNGYVAIVWLDREGTQVGISQSTTTSLSNASFTRKTATGSVPAGAAVAVPIAVVVSASADEYLLADGAVFGFGAATDYKDGNSGSGWEWVGEKGFSESRQIGTGVDYWGSVNGTLAQNGTFATDRTNNATYTVTNSAANCYAYAFRNDDADDRRFKLKPNSVNPLITFAVDVRAVSVNQQFELKLLLVKWTGQGWQASSAPANPTTVKTTINSGATTRMLLTVDTSTFNIGDATHFRPAVFVYNSSGGNAALGQVFRIDAACLSRDDVGTYLDGTQGYVIWMGTADASESKRVGPARKLRVERVAAIEPDSSDGGELAFLTVAFNAPYVFWEDTITKTQKLALPRKGGILSFDSFQGMTAPVNDAVITLNGPFHDITITDMASGEWLRLDLRLADDQSVVIDGENWEVRRGNGKLVFSDMRHSSGSILLPMSVAFDKDVPRFKVEADAIGRGAWMKVSGRRRYLVA